VLPRRVEGRRHVRESADHGLPLGGGQAAHRHRGPVPESDEGVLLADVVAVAQARFGRHPAFPGGRLRNYCTFTEVDLEARCLIERVPGSGPQRLRLRRDPPTPITRSEQPDDVEEGVAGPSPS
jgi:hypothetical protein